MPAHARSARASASLRAPTNACRPERCSDARGSPAAAAPPACRSARPRNARSDASVVPAGTLSIRTSREACAAAAPRSAPPTWSWDRVAASRDLRAHQAVSRAHTHEHSPSSHFSATAQGVLAESSGARPAPARRRAEQGRRVDGRGIMTAVGDAPRNLICARPETRRRWSARRAPSCWRRSAARRTSSGGRS